MHSYIAYIYMDDIFFPSYQTAYTIVWHLTMYWASLKLKVTTAETIIYIIAIIIIKIHNVCHPQRNLLEVSCRLVYIYWNIYTYPQSLENGMFGVVGYMRNESQLDEEKYTILPYTHFVDLVHLTNFKPFSNGYEFERIEVYKCYVIRTDTTSRVLASDKSWRRIILGRL